VKNNCKTKKRLRCNDLLKSITFSIGMQQDVGNSGVELYTKLNMSREEI
jgi:hypothetical protein